MRKAAAHGRHAAGHTGKNAPGNVPHFPRPATERQKKAAIEKKIIHYYLAIYEKFVDLQHQANPLRLMEKLTAQEEQVMRLVWELGTCFVKDIVARFDEPRPPYTTVASVVKNLERKGYVRTRRVGNTYQYTPLVEESDYKRTFLGSFVRNYFDDSYKDLVAFFAREQQLSAEDLKEIIRLIEKGGPA